MTKKKETIKPKFNFPDKIKADAEKHLFNSLKNTEFPIEIFPERIKYFINELDKNCSYPPAVTSAAILAASGLAIGNNIELYFKNEWKEASVIWICIVGIKGSHKSHAIKTIFNVFNQLDNNSFKAFTKDLASWQARKDAAKAEKEPFDEAQPTWQRYTVDSFTIEKLAEILNENRRGIIVINDELRAWFKSFSQYDTDSLDKWLKMFNRGRIVVDRIGRGTTQIQTPFTSVIGTIQPEVLERIITSDFKESGLIDRMLFVSINPVLRYNESDINPDLLNEWSATINRLLLIGGSDLKYIYLSNEAKLKFTNWKHEQIKFLNENETERNLGGKWDNYILRFALIIHCLYNMDNAVSNEVSGESFEKAIKLTTYFQNQYYTLFGEKDSYHVRKLSELQRLVYSALPGVFKTGEGVQIAAEAGMKEKTFKRWLNGKSNPYFKFKKHGEYEKLIEL